MKTFFQLFVLAFCASFTSCASNNVNCGGGGGYASPSFFGSAPMASGCGGGMMGGGGMQGGYFRYWNTTTTWCGNASCMPNGQAVLLNQVRNGGQPNGSYYGQPGGGYRDSRGYINGYYRDPNGPGGTYGGRY